MLYFTRWKALAIILTALVVCLCAVPNFFPEAKVKTWPKWAQRHLVLGLDLQGGSHLLLEVDTKTVRKDMLEALRDDVRRVLRDARVGYTGLVVRGNAVEVRIREGSNAADAYQKLAALSQPLGGILGASGNRSLDVTQDGNLIRLAPSEPALRPWLPVDGRRVIPTWMGANRYARGREARCIRRPSHCIISVSPVTAPNSRR